MLKIMINPEHGGADGGAAYGGLMEKTLNLKVAKYCCDYLGDYQCRVFLSRETDKDMGITERLNLLKKEGAKAVVTVAHNAGGGDGCEIFYWQGDTKSKTFAAVLEKYYKALGQNSRGVKESSEGAYNFAMVREPSKMGFPAILSEFAFLDNAADRQMVDSDADLKGEGEAIAKAAIEYFGLKKKESSQPETPSQPDLPASPDSGGNDSEPSGDPLYRVGTGWSDDKCLGQKGAFAVYENAINFCKELGEGYKVFDGSGKKVYPADKDGSGVGSSSPAPNPTPITPAAPSAPCAGMAVRLSGAKLYGSASAATPANTVTGTYYLYDGENIGGRYRITTSKERCGKTPIGKNVTGYVDASAIGAASGSVGSSSTSPAPSAPYAGMAVKLSGVKLYGSATASTPANTVTGTYYLYDGENIGGRYRVTTSKDRCGKEPIGDNVTGYVNASAVKAV